MKKYYVRYITALLLFGSNGIVASHIALNSYEIVCLRTFIGSVLLISIFLLAGNRFTFYKSVKSFMFLTISGIAMGLSWMFLYEAYNRMGVSVASLCYYCGPVIVMVLAPVLFKEKLTFIKISGFISVLIGICLINSQSITGGGNIFGVACGLISAVMYALMVIFNKKADKITGMENSVIQLMVSFLTVAVFVLFKQGLIINLSRESIPWILFLGIANTGIGCLLYFSSIGNLPVQTVAVTGYLEPLSAVIFSVLFLHEYMGIIQIAGAICIIGGAVWSEGIVHISS